MTLVLLTQPPVAIRLSHCRLGDTHLHGELGTCQLHRSHWLITIGEVKSASVPWLHAHVPPWRLPDILSMGDLVPYNCPMTLSWPSCYTFITNSCFYPNFSLITTFLFNIWGAHLEPRCIWTPFNTTNKCMFTHATLFSRSVLRSRAQDVEIRQQLTNRCVFPMTNLRLTRHNRRQSREAEGM